MTHASVPDTFPKLLLHRTRQHPNKIAMREKDLGIWQGWTWCQMYDEVRALACGLAAMGLVRGDKVAVIGDNRPQLYWAMIAAQCLGGVPVPLYQDAVAEEMQFVLEHAETRFAVVEDQEQVDKLLAVQERCLKLEKMIYDDPRGLRHYHSAGLHAFTGKLWADHKGGPSLALQAMAAVLGGAQSLHTNSRDEALALPTEESVQIALRTQQIIAHETGVATSVDPVGGAYAIEALTTAIEERAQAYIEQIDAMGGAVRAIEHGFPQREIQHSAYQYQQEIEARSRIVVGVNAYTLENEPTPPLLRIDPDLERQQIARLQGLRAQRNNAQVKAVLHRLEHAARGSENLMPLLIEAVEYYATLGEIADTLRAVFGEHQEQIVLTGT